MLQNHQAMHQCVTRNLCLTIFALENQSILKSKVVIEVVLYIQTVYIFQKK